MAAEDFGDPASLRIDPRLDPALASCPRSLTGDWEHLFPTFGWPDGKQAPLPDGVVARIFEGDVSFDGAFDYRLDGRLVHWWNRWSEGGGEGATEGYETRLDPSALDTVRALLAENAELIAESRTEMASDEESIFGQQVGVSIRSMELPRPDGRGRISLMAEAPAAGDTISPRARLYRLIDQLARQLALRCPSR